MAQHSVLVSEYAPETHAMLGLMHDASEAYLGDVSTPLKSLLPQYVAIEDSVSAAIALRFGLEWPHKDTCVKVTDKRMTLTEAALFGFNTDTWGWTGIEPYPIKRIVPWSHRYAEHAFLQRFRELDKARQQ